MRSSKPFAATMSSRQPDALPPFQVGRVVVNRSAAAAAKSGTASLVQPREAHPRLTPIHRTEKGRPASTSSRVIARLTSSGSLTQPPERNRPLLAFAAWAARKSPLGIRSPSENTR